MCVRTCMEPPRTRLIHDSCDMQCGRGVDTRPAWSFVAELQPSQSVLYCSTLLLTCQAVVCSGLVCSKCSSLHAAGWFSLGAAATVLTRVCKQALSFDGCRLCWCGCPGSPSLDAKTGGALEEEQR